MEVIPYIPKFPSSAHRLTTLMLQDYYLGSACILALLEQETAFGIVERFQITQASSTQLYGDLTAMCKNPLRLIVSGHENIVTWEDPRYIYALAACWNNVLYRKKVNIITMIY